MFYLTARVGSMFAIYDNTDNSVEWYEKPQLDKFLSIGVVIKGYSSSGIKVNNNLMCPFHSCNWTKSKSNIFDVVKRVTRTSDMLIIFAENKKFKCKIYDNDNIFLYAKFSNGLNVKIPMDWLNQYI